MRAAAKKRDQRKNFGLKGLRALEGVGGDVVARLNALGESLSMRKRQVAYLPGDPGDGVYFIVTGRVKISRVTRDGKELTLGYRGGGEIFGELCLFDAGPREEMAEVVDAAEMVRVDRAALAELTESHAALSVSLARQLAGRCRDLQRQMEFLMFKDVHAKLAELLLRLSSEFGVKDPRGTLVALSMTHQEMANLIGSTRETVSLALSQFKRQKLVQSDGRRVIVLNADGLRSIS